MRSQFVDKFNHDAEAAGYDQDVLNEQHPIRAGYSDLLDWVIATAQVEATCSIVDLGTGTGNLVKQLPSFGHLVCVDTSYEMLRIAREKLIAWRNVDFVQSDILEYFDAPRTLADAIISTYAIHHLVEEEKTQLFRAIAAGLKPNGIAVFGDLMFENDHFRQRYMARLRQSSQTELANEIEEEFFWNIKHAACELKSLGFSVSVRRFSELSWGVSARKTSGGEFAT